MSNGNNQTGRPHACLTCKRSNCNARPTNRHVSVESCTGYLGPHQDIRQVIAYG